MPTYNSAKKLVPIGSTELSRRTQGRDGVLFRLHVVQHEVFYIIHVEMSCKMDANLYSVMHVLFLDRLQEGMKPFYSGKAADHPCEIDLA